MHPSSVLDQNSISSEYWKPSVNQVVFVEWLGSLPSFPLWAVARLKYSLELDKIQVSTLWASCPSSYDWEVLLLCSLLQQGGEGAWYVKSLVLNPLLGNSKTKLPSDMKSCTGDVMVFQNFSLHEYLLRSHKYPLQLQGIWGLGCNILANNFDW